MKRLALLSLLFSVLFMNVQVVAEYFSGAEFLYWKMDECGMDNAFCYDKPVAIDPDNNDFPGASIVGDLISAELRWWPGFHVFAGYICRNSCPRLTTALINLQGVTVGFNFEW